MKRQCFLFAFIIISLNAFSIDSTISKLNFWPISTLNSLPSDEVQQVYRDHEGFMWLATRSGLCSYDGYQVKSYRTSAFSPNLFVSNNIYCLAEDYSYNLWIGTGNGLYMLNKRTGNIRKVNLSGNNTISTLLVTLDNNVWIGTDDGLSRYNPKNKSFRTYNSKTTRNIPASYSVKSLLQDTNGDILMGTWCSGLYRFNPRTGVFQAYPQFNARQSAHTLYLDSYNRLWVGTWLCGLFCIENPQDVKHPIIKSYANNSLNPNSLPDNIVYSITEDPLTHTLWVGTRTGLSIMTIDHPQNSFINYTTTSKQYPLPGNEINSVLTNGKGDFWLGTIGSGVLQTSTRPSFFRSYDLSSIKKVVSTNAVRTMYVASPNKIWIGVGSYGLALYDRVNNTSTFYTQMPEFASLKEMPSIYSIISQPNGEIWFATYGGGILIYKKGKPVKTLSSTNSKWLIEDCVLCLHRARNGVTWVGQRSGISVMLRNNKGYRLNFIHDGNRELSNCKAQSIMEDKLGNIWVSTDDQGIIRISGDPFHPTKLKFHHYSPENKKLPISDVISLIQDHRSNIWAVSNSGGLLLWDRKSDTFIPVNKVFHIPGDDARSIVEDRFGNLWISTNYGIVKVTFNKDIMHPAIQIYTTADGLQDNFFIPNAVTKYGNELFFGYYKGFCSFVPQSLNALNVTVPTVAVTDLKIYDRSYSELDSILRSRISDVTPSFTRKIVIPPSCNNFTFEFSSLTYAHSNQCKYAYQLAGFDDAWQYTDANRRFAYYSNLPSGTYHFSLRATDSSGFWYDMPYTITVVVQPPFYATWWAYLIYCILIGGIIYIIIRVSRNRMQLQNSLRMEEMEKKQIEILNHSKLQFFTNITHELLTPLAIISASVDHLRMIAPQNSEDYSVMKTNVNRLIRLIQQILEFRKAQTGNLKLQVSKGNLSTFVKSEVESFYPLMNKKNLHLTYQCDKDDIVGYFDQDKFDKIIYNLLSNAAKYNKEGGSVQVSFNYGEDDNHIVFIVKDNGVGISEDAKAHLFERFYDGEYRKFKTQGTGIGLSLTNDLVSLHGGIITVESESGEGSLFVVTIPVDRSFFSPEQIDERGASGYLSTDMVAESNTLIDEMPEEEQDVIDDKEKNKVLIVEDNTELLTLMSKLLSHDYHVIKAVNGEDGIKVVQSEQVDLIVSDVMMPVMDGIEFTKYIKNNIDYCHIPIVLLTAKDKDEDRTEGYDSGADGYITKPFQLSVLLARIKNLLTSRSRLQKDFKNQLVFELKDLNYTSMDEDFLQRAIDCVNRSLDDTEFDQAKFVTEMNTSKSTLYNKLKSLTGLNTSAFIRNIRLKAACKIVEENPNIRVSELAYLVGFNDPKYFSSCFKKEFGMLVNEYVEKFKL